MQIRPILNKLSEPRNILTGGISSVVTDIFFYHAPKLRLSRIDFPLLNGTIILSPGPSATVLGRAMFYTGGVFWVTLFRTCKGEINLSLPVKGILFANSLFLFSSLIAMPMLGLINPRMRRGIVQKPGVLGLKLGGWKIPATSFCGHMLFGLTVVLCEKAFD